MKFRTEITLIVLFLVLTLVLAVGPNYPALDEGEVDIADEVMLIKYSNYWPPSSGKSRESFRNMASGLPWMDYVGSAVACPWKWPFETTVTLDGKTWICLDRSSQSGIMDDIPHLDFLTETAVYDWGTLVEVRVRFVR